MEHFPINESQVLSVASVISITVAVTRWVLSDAITTVSDLCKQWTRVKHERAVHAATLASKRPKGD